MYACLWKVCSSSLFLLRCSSNKMYLMSGSSLINISYGNRCEAKKSSGRGQQQPGSAGTPSRPPFSPSLGASPELGKKNKHRSPDVRLESPGVCAALQSNANRPFPNRFEPHYESKAKSKVFIMKISFHSNANKTNFYMKNFALSLALIMKFTATRKRPIDQTRGDSENSSHHWDSG